LYQSNEGDGSRKKAADIIEDFQNVMLKVSEEERKTLHAYRKNPDFDDDILKLVENRLDLEEERLEDNVE